MSRFTALVLMFVLTLLPLRNLSASDNVIDVSEVMANAADEDTGEFIEINNTSESSVNLGGWRLSDLVDTSDELIPYTNDEFMLGIGGMTVPAGGFAIIVDPEYSGEYNAIIEEHANTEELVMVTVDDTTLGNGLGNTSDTLTLLDEDGTVQLEVFWDLDAGNATSLELNEDGDFEPSAFEFGSTPGFFYTPPSAEEPEPPTPCNIIITELFPNPIGSDADGEFIELLNRGPRCSLLGYSLDDAEGGSSPYRLPNAEIAANSYLVIDRSESGIALNNSNESVRLFDGDGAVVSKVSYTGSAKEGESYALFGGTFSWTQTPTPGEKNTKTKKEKGSEKDEAITENEDPNTAVTQRESIATTRQRDVRSSVAISGIVTVAPGKFSDKYFYVQDASAGIQVYSSKEDFPELQQGNRVTVVGKLSQAGGEKRILTSTAADIRVNGSGTMPPPRIIKTGALGDSYEGSVVALAGKVTKKTSTGFTLDDGSGDAKITIDKDAEIEKPTMQTGDVYTVVGIASETSSGFRVLPRSTDEIKAGNQLGSLPTAGSHIWPVSLLAGAVSFSVAIVVAVLRRRRYA